MKIEGTITYLPEGNYGLFVHENLDNTNECLQTGAIFNPEAVSSRENINLTWPEIFDNMRRVHIFDNDCVLLRLIMMRYRKEDTMPGFSATSNLRE